LLFDFETGAAGELGAGVDVRLAGDPDVDGLEDVDRLEDVGRLEDEAELVGAETDTGKVPVVVACNFTPWPFVQHDSVVELSGAPQHHVPSSHGVTCGFQMSMVINLTRFERY
jgi:hypothetical protein